ncbi:MAG TPA: alcohol dehydrogenase catalytic domain-containing protein [Streptosporangiaceae bacterium]
MTRSPGEMVVADVPEPDVPGPGSVKTGNVIVRPEAVGICGSDFHLFSGDVDALSGIRDFYPRIQGHEVSAIVEESGERVAIHPLLPCGGCYPCRHNRPNVCVNFRLIGVHTDGGLQEYLTVPAEAAFAVGDLDPDCTAFVETASVAVHALARGRLAPGEQVVVFGAGPIGLAAVVAAADAGARVLSIDPVAARRDLARRLGAEEAIWAGRAGSIQESIRESIQEPIRERIALVRDWTGGDGPALVVEASGETSILSQAVEMVSAAGRVVMVGMSSGIAPLRPGVFPEKEIDVIGSSCATADDFRTAARLVSKHKTALAELFTHHFPLTRAVEAFEFAMSRPPDAIKVIVTVNLEGGDE